MSRYTQDEIDELALDLPDFVNGKLSAQRMSEIEAALQEIPALQDELDDIKALHSAMHASYKKTSYEGLEANPERLHKVISEAKATQSQAVKKAVSAPLKDRLYDLLYGGNLWKPAFAVACGVLVLQSVLPAAKTEAPSTVQALSGDQVETNNLYLVKPAPTAKYEALETLFSELGLVILGGPEGGFLKIGASAEIDEAAVFDALSNATGLIDMALLAGDNQ